MKFFDKLRMETQGDAARLQSTPQIVDALHGRITRQAYIDYLAQAFHHVRHTVPLMQAAKARLDDQHARFRLALDEYIEEETGHEEWILDDIAAAGGDAEGVRRSQPNEATELMVAYAYDQVQRGNPMSFSGWSMCLRARVSSWPTWAPRPFRKALACPLPHSAT